MEPKYGDLVGGGEEGSYKEGKRGKVEGRKWCQKRGDHETDTPEEEPDPSDGQ